MILICPNCDTEYKLRAVTIPENGIEVQCLECDQTWFEYNFDIFENEKSVDSADTQNDELKKLASEELSINLGKKPEISAADKKVTDPDYDEKLIKETHTHAEIQNRLKDSSDLLKKAQSNLNQIKIKPEEKKRSFHNSTIFGFLTSSGLFLILLFFYLYSNEILQVFPDLSSIMDSYVLIIDIMLKELLQLGKKIKNLHT